MEPDALQRINHAGSTTWTRALSIAGLRATRLIEQGWFERRYVWFGMNVEGALADESQ